MSHPEPGDLALFAGSDLPFWSRWRVSAHVRSCEDCQRQVRAFRGRRDWVREAAEELPASVHWGALAAEMKANIQLGLAAGECIRPAEPAREPLGWRAAAALASITLVVISGWWLHLPRPRLASSLELPGVVLAATAEGIEVKQKDGALTLLHSASEPVMFSVSAQGAMTARFVDDETGMVTINNVYVQ